MKFTSHNYEFKRVPAFSVLILLMLPMLLLSNMATTTLEDFFLENDSIMLFIDPESGQIIKANSTAKKFYGYENLTNMTIYQINTFEKEQVEQEMRQAAKEDRNYFKFNHKLADNSVQKVKVYSRPIKYDNKRILYSIIEPLTLEEERAEHFNARLEEQVEIQKKLLQEGYRKNKISFIVIVVTLAFAILVLLFLLKYKISLQTKLQKQQQVMEQEQLELMIEKERNKLAIGASNLGVWDWNINTNKVYFSPRCKSIIGYGDNEIGSDFDEFASRVHPDDMEQFSLNIKLHVQGKTELYKNVFRMRHKNGCWVWILSRGKIFIDKSKNIQRFIGIHKDITEEKNHKEVLEQKIEEAMAKSREQEALLQKQGKMAAMGEMISMIAHQWRQPISVISMDVNNILVDLELDSLDNEELSKTLRDITLQVEELSKTIDDFRDFFKPQKNIEKTLLSEVVNNALGIVGKSLENDNIELKFDAKNDSEIKTFSRELMQVVINILKNAKDAFEDRGIANKKIDISFVRGDETMELWICDNAGGIEKEIIGNIFDPYFTTKDEKNGTGLGLYMSKIIVQKHLKGSIEVFNNKEGACFQIVLPLTSEGGVENG